MKKLLFVFGTRPEAIKMLPIIVKAKTAFKYKFMVKVCVTAQHRQMLDQVLKIFNIEPDYDLDIKSKGKDLYDITSKTLLGLRNVLKDYSPDCVIVHGDTTTTMAGSLASFYQKIPLAHVEAGLRTNDIYNPWPEEINRTITGCIADYHFAPTELSKRNLLMENINKNVYVVGNSVIDSLLWITDKLNNDEKLKSSLDVKFKSYGIDFNKNIILITGHRRENFGKGFLNICKAIKSISIKHSNVQLVYPVHLNPNVQRPVNSILSGLDNVLLVEPQEYISFIYLMQKSYMILTDSGGIQEEAPSLNKPVLVMRNTTERPEAVKSGTVKLDGSSVNNIVSEVSELLKGGVSFNSMCNSVNPYGDGKTSNRILDVLCRI